MPATGPLELAKEALKNTLAACTALQTWQGNSWTEAEVKERIFLEGLPGKPHGEEFSRGELEAARPFVEIYHDEESFQIEWDATPGCNFDSGTIMARFEQDVPAAAKHDRALGDQLFNNFIGQLICSGDANNPGIAELLQSGGAYFVPLTTRQAGPYRTDPKDLGGLGDAQEVVLYFDYGRPN